MSLARGTILGKKWVVGDLVGEGACGHVYAVSSNGNNSSSYYSSSSSSSSAVHRWVAKVIPLPKGSGKGSKDQKRICDTLFYEYTLFHSQLSEFTFRPAIPDVLSFHGVDDGVGVRFMVMERFERDLIGLARSASKPTIAQVATIGLQVVDGLEWLHRKGFLFIDVKPDNFMLNSDQRVFFVDYGLVDRWGSAMGGVKPDQPREMVGTPTFASIDVHSGHTPQRKDDMESCAMVLISLFSEGTMPWSSSKSDGELQMAKKNCDMEALTQSLNCPELGAMVLQARALKYDEKPNYDGYRQLLAAMRDRKVSVDGAAVGAKKAAGGSSRPRAAAVTVHDVGVADAADDDSKKKGKGASARASKKAVVMPKTPLLPCGDDDDDAVEVVVVSRDITSKSIRGKRGGGASSSSSSSSSVASVTTKRGGSFSAAVGAATAVTTTAASSRKSPRLSLEDPSRSRASNSGAVDAKALYVEVMSGPHMGESYTLGSSADQKVGEMQQRVIGRSEVSDVALGRDDFVSEKHLTLLWQWTAGGQLDLNIQDRQSSNGTKLNGTRLTALTWQSVNPGDVLLLGTTELKVCCGDSKEDEKGAKKSNRGKK